MPSDACAAPASSSIPLHIRLLRWAILQRTTRLNERVQQQAVQSLSRAAVNGDAHATLALAQALSAPNQLRTAILAALHQVSEQNCIDALWQYWTETRSTELTSVLLQRNWEAKASPWTKVLSALRLDKLDLLVRATTDLIDPLICACGDSDPVIAGRAQTALHNLKSQPAIDVFCARWESTRQPLLTAILTAQKFTALRPYPLRVLTLLKNDLLLDLCNEGPEVIPVLLQAHKDRDASLAHNASLALTHLQNTDAIDALCQQWKENRSPLLGQAIREARYTAQMPPELRLYSALKAGRLDVAEQTPPTLLATLLQAAQDADPEVANAAVLALHNLQNKATREELCAFYLDQNRVDALQIIQKAGYLPENTERRALFLFLTSQWQLYEVIDFDQSILRTTYETAAPALRQRIAHSVQQAGRTEFLKILAGGDYRSRLNAVNTDESELLVRVLRANQEWQRLWDLVFELPPITSLQIIRMLAKSTWEPAQEDARRAYEDLRNLAAPEMLLAPAELQPILPLAIPRATMRVSSRVNDIDFAPNSPTLAIATSQRNVVFWDFQRMQTELTLTAFGHSVGRVRYTAQGALCIGERGQNGSSSGVYYFENRNLERIGAHQGAVTALELVGAAGLLSTGRDQRAVLYHLAERRILHEETLPFWARACAISPGGRHAALMHNALTLLSLPDLHPQPDELSIHTRGNGRTSKTARCAVFEPQGERILFGAFNGQIVSAVPRDGLYKRGKAFTQHNGSVEGLQFVPEHPILVSADSSGEVRFFQWPQLTLAGRSQIPAQRITSLRISPDGNFMATGTSEAAMTLWDLRPMDIPTLLSQPLASARPNQLAAVSVLAQDAQIPAPVQNALRFLQYLLQYRFRFDIQVADLTMIPTGEFDIVVEG